MRCFTIKDGNIENYEVNHEFDIKTDIFIAGLGTAGAIAAIKAAETGLDVIGIDRLTGMGGIGTFGCVWDYYFGSAGGRYEDINNECKKMLENGYVDSDNTQQGKSIPLAVKSYILEKNAVDAGCKIWYETVVTGIYIEKNKVVGVRCLRNGKQISVKTTVVIDCTGEAALCKMAGCKMVSGRKSDGLMMRASKAIGIINNGYMRGVWNTVGRINKRNAKYISDIILESGVRPPCLRDLYSEDARVFFGSTILGIRESQRIIPEEELSFAGYADGRMASKPILYAFAPVDNVNNDIAFESEAQQDWHLICSMGRFGLSVGISMGTLIPKGLNGILAAGKGIGIDHDFATCIRMKKDFEKCGEAAAAIAFLSIKEDKEVKDVSYEKLKLILEESGCLDKRNNIGLGDLRTWDGHFCKKVCLPVEPEETRKEYSIEFSSNSYY